MVTCSHNNAGCNGGLLTGTIDYLSTEGVVTSECKSYASGVGANGICKYWCDDLSVEYKKYYCKSGTMKIPTSKADIMDEVMNHGPMQVGFLIYDDFLLYETGIYQNTKEAVIVGAHAVKLIGWDHDSDGILYWICQNQWAADWGESGYFNIYENVAGLDTMAIACEPDLDRLAW